MRICKSFIGGEWVAPPATGTSPVFNPALGEIIAEVPLAGAELVDHAAQAASAAFPAWRDTPAVDRAGILFRYKALIEAEFESIALTISTEHGKTPGEARGDLRRGIQMVEYACGAPSLLMGESLENIARGIDCDAIRQPLGVCAGIVPFNFPAMVPLWMFPLSLACGNTFILKPSEKVPLTATRLAELLDAAGLPKGVFNVVHGGRACVDALLVHPAVRAISFVGSTSVARHVFDTGTRHGKRVQAAGGAKNFILIMPDATVAESVRGLAEAAFGCAGERCMSGSTAIAIGRARDLVIPDLVSAAKHIRVGAAFRDASAEMGPVITRQHRDRVESLIDAGEREGARVAADGRSVRVEGAPNGFYVGPTILDGVAPDATVMREEIFGPVLSVLHMDDLDSAIETANRSAYGNGAAIFTSSGRAAREFRHRINAGMVGVNVAVPAPMAFFPFSGWNESFFGDLHVQGREGIAFYTQQKITTSRWFAAGEGDVWVK
ncbi:MAG: CoA-acylating methylmalonate-semialdehyde dehydrogenase [Terrimicrobiaceae bacterium]|nr:CoA-acylating methylmalonate-semialdehyde dehydrogenase [Terrimicrobiaceae bacterium]